MLKTKQAFIVHNVKQMVIIAWLDVRIASPVFAPQKESCSKMQAVLRRSTILNGYVYMNSDYTYMKSLQMTAHSWFVWEIPTNHKRFCFPSGRYWYYSAIQEKCHIWYSFNTRSRIIFFTSPQSLTTLQITWISLWIMCQYSS